jgi:hypothetical protein
VGQVVCDLLGLQQNVERHDDRARLEDPEVGDQEGGDVGELERDPLSPTDTAVLQGDGKTVRQVVELGVGHPTARPRRDRLERRDGSGLAQHDGQVEHGGLLGVALRAHL